MKMPTSLLLSGLTALGLLATATQADVLAIDDVVHAELLPGWRQADGTHMAGLRISLAPGWKTYWRAPGDAGIPPQLSLGGSENIAATATHWPQPEVSEQNGMRVIGYSDQVVFPLKITPKEKGAPIKLSGNLHIGVCEDVCIPVTLTLSATLPPTGAKSAEISAGLNDRARTESEAGVRSVVCEIAPIKDGMRVTAHINMPSAGGSEVTVFEVQDKSVWVSEAQSQRSGKMLVASADLVPESGSALVLNRNDIRISVFGRSHMVDIRGCTAG